MANEGGTGSFEANWQTMLPALGAIVGATSIGMGALYAVGYFTFAGLKFISFLTVTDFIRLSVQALPFALIFLFAITSSAQDNWRIAGRAIERGKQERNRFFRSSMVLSVLLAIIAVGLFAAFPKYLGEILIFSSIVFYTAIGTARTHEAREQTRTPIELILALIGASLTIAGVGALAASADLGPKEGRYCFTFPDKKVRAGVLLFKTDTGYIISLDDEIVGDERLIVYYPTDKIERMCYLPQPFFQRN